MPGELNSIFVHQPDDLLDLPEYTQLRFNSTYAPLYSAKNRFSDTRSRTIRAGSVYAGWFSGVAGFRYYLSCRHDNDMVDYLSNDQNYSFNNQRDEWNVSSGISYRKRNTTVGFGLGRHWPKHMDREHLFEIAKNPGGYLLRGPWQLSLAAQVHLSKVTARLSLFSGPVHSSLSRLATSDKQRYRMFPLSIVKHTAEAGVDLDTKSLSMTFGAGFDHYEHSDLQTVRNCMPQDVAISQYRLMYKGALNVSFTDSLWWDLSGAVAGGWVASHNFNRNRFTFFKSESLRLKVVDFSAGITLPYTIKTGIALTLFSVTSPEGLLKLSALSAWSVFKQLDYRYTNAKAAYVEAGGFVNRSFSRGCVEIDPRLSMSYIKTKMKVTYSHKEIVVLLPLYVDPVTAEVFNSKIVQIKPGVSFSVKAGCIHLNGTVDQMIPLVIRSDEQKHSNVQPSDKEPASEKHVGGTTLSVSATWSVPDFGRRKSGE